jgi:hypothetical protein
MLEKFYTHICNIGKHVQNANERNSSYRYQFKLPRTYPPDLMIWSPDFTKNLFYFILIRMLLMAVELDLHNLPDSNHYM